MLFIVGLDTDFKNELNKLCSAFEIQSSKVGADSNFTIRIPLNKDRSNFILQKLWWSLLGWAKKETNMAASVNFSLKKPSNTFHKFPDGLWIRNLLKSVAASPVLANLLPPGFELHFEKYNTLPEKVIVVPEGHSVLLHCKFGTTSGGTCYAVIGKGTVKGASKSKAKLSLYSMKTEPYLLVCLHDASIKMVIKIGFFLDEKSLKAIECLPGVSTSIMESLQLKELIDRVPVIVCAVLRKKGFTSLKSLLLWLEFLSKYPQK